VGLLLLLLQDGRMQRDAAETGSKINVINRASLAPYLLFISMHCSECLHHLNIDRLPIVPAVLMLHYNVICACFSKLMMMMMMMYMFSMC